MARVIEHLNDNWQFSLGETMQESAEIVTIPHCVSLSPANASGCVNYQGAYCYRKMLHIPQTYQGKRLVLEFEGIMGVADLSLNGEYLQTSYCSYLPFVVDVTEKVRYGADNEIFIGADNSDRADVPPGKEQAELDFTYEGGMYRKAKLIVMEPVHITHELLAQEVAGGGVFVWSEDVLSDVPKVCAKVHVANENAVDCDVQVAFTLSYQGKEVAKEAQKLNLQANCTQYAQVMLAVPDAALWSVETPNLYQLQVEVMEEASVLDSASVDVGIRTFAFLTGKGTIWNGESHKLRGANYHPTFPYIGNAMPDNLMIRDIKKLKQAGMENLRSHYPFAKSFLDACNELGMTMIVSAPGWQWFQEGIFLDRAKENVRNMVRYQRNNPCVILWEPILNESDMTMSFQKEVSDIVHAEYPYAPCYTASDHGDTDVSYSQFDAGMLSPLTQDSLSEKEPRNLPVWVREYGDSPDNWTDHNCSWRSPRGWGDGAMMRSVERMLSFDPQKTNSNYVEMYNQENICGYGVWPGIEHNRGYHVNPCWGGYLDMFRIPKFAFYFMESQQSIASVGVKLFIANWWSEISPWDVTIFSNAQKVRLYYDDVLVGEQDPIDLAIACPPFVFKEVRQRFKKRDRAVLKAEALVDGKVVATQEIKSPGVPQSLKLVADCENVPFVADGNDIIAVQCHMTDDLGQTVALNGDRFPILFSVEGEGEIVGDQSIGANPLCADAGIATVLVRSSHKAGKLTVKAELLYKQHNPRTAIKSAELVLHTTEGEI